MNASCGVVWCGELLEGGVNGPWRRWWWLQARRPWSGNGRMAALPGAKMRMTAEAEWEGFVLPEDD